MTHSARRSSIAAVCCVVVLMLWCRAPLWGEERRIAIAPRCPTDERWYIDITYAYTHPAVSAWRVRFSFDFAEREGAGGDTAERATVVEERTAPGTAPGTADSAAFSRRSPQFEAIVHRQSTSLPLHSARLPAPPTHLVLPSLVPWFTVTDVRCRAYIPFPTPRNSTVIHPMDTATLVDINDFDTESGSNFLIYRWNHFPDMLLVDTRNHATLGKLFNRLAFFIEKVGYAGTVYTDAALAGKFAWNGHNYNAEDLAHFFNSAQQNEVPLNEYELEFRNILLAHGVIRAANGGSYSAGAGGVVAVSQQQGGYVRRLILQHELLHAVFYSSVEYRAAVRGVWSRLSPREQQGWRMLLSYLTYDPDNEYVMVNEFQAYLLAKPPPQSVSQLTTVARRFLTTDSAAAEYIDPLLRNDSKSLRDTREQLSLLLSAYTGLSTGILRTIE